MAQNSHDPVRNCGDVSIGIDRISDLPEAIICHILSFLPTRDVVKAALVSPKFINLWKNITTLRFTHHASDMDKPLTKFIDFVNKVFLLLETKCIDILSIELSGFNSGNEWKITGSLSNWVEAAIGKNVKSFELLDRCGLWFCLQLPSCIFNCNSLEILRLRNIDVTLNRTCSVRLPNLRMLRMEDNCIIDEYSIGEIVSDCSSLHALYLSRRNENAFKISVCSPTLEHLTIISSNKYWLSSRDENKEGRIKIDAPALKYLNLNKTKLKYFSIKTSSRLIKAAISLGAANCELGTFDDLQALYNVKVLKLDVSNFWLVDGANSCLLPMFPNLTSLTLANFCNEFNFVNELLRKCPILETLDLECTNRWGGYNCSQPNEIPRYVSPFLKMVKVGDFCGGIDQLRLLKYILMNASMLNKMKIKTRACGRENLELVQEILKFRCKSKYCEIGFIEMDLL